MVIERKYFNSMTPDELYEILRLRSEIFVVEQNCIYNDLDGHDKEALHFFISENSRIIAYSRVLKPGTRFTEHSIGRVVVKKEKRGRNLSTLIVNYAKHYILNEMDNIKIRINAQQYLQKFYENLGFEIVTDLYLEDGIPHYAMLYEKK